MHLKYHLTKPVQCPNCCRVCFPKDIYYEQLIPRRAGLPLGQWVMMCPYGHSFKMSDDEANKHGITARKESLWQKMRRRFFTLASL